MSYYGKFNNQVSLDRVSRPAHHYIDLAQRAKLDKDPLIQSILFALSVKGNRSLEKALISRIGPKALMESLNPFPFNSPSDAVSDRNINSPLLIGKIKKEFLDKEKQRPRPFLYPVDAFNQHGIVLGGSGTGKTNLLFGIIMMCKRLGKNVLIFDKDKEDFRQLLQIDDDFKVFDAQKYPLINPLQPPTNVPLQFWIMKFVEVFCLCNDLLSRSESFLLKHVSELYDDFGVAQGRDTFPTLIDLFEKINTVKGFDGDIKKRVLDRLGSYIAVCKEVYEYSHAVPIEWIAQNNIIIEVKGLTDRIAKFTVNMILLSLFLYRIAVGERGNILRNLVVIDECKWLAPENKNYTTPFSVLSRTLSQARETGLGFLFADQTAQLDHSLFVNTRLKICGRLGSGWDVRKIQETMRLTKEQADYLSKLDTGECIVVIPREDPFVIETLKVKI